MLVDEVHRANQRCAQSSGCDPAAGRAGLTEPMVQCGCGVPGLTRAAAQVLLNVLADEIHRAHQRCTHAAACDPLLATQDLVFEAGASTMRMLQGAYSCLCLIKSVGLVAFRDPFGIRCAWSPGLALRTT